MAKDVAAKTQTDVEAMPDPTSKFPQHLSPKVLQLMTIIVSDSK